MNHDLAAVIPAYDCADSIGAVVVGALRHVGRVVVYDDGSRDGTADVARAAGAEVLHGGENRGKGVGLRAGVDAALAHDPEAIVLLDGDGQHDPDDIPALVAAYRAGEGELIVGARLQDSAAMPRARYWANRIGTGILSIITGVRLEDSQSGFRLLSAQLLRRLHLVANGYAIESEMLIKASRLGAPMTHVSVRTIYGNERSHYRPVQDTVRISLHVVYFRLFGHAARGS